MLGTNRNTLAFPGSDLQRAVDVYAQSGPRYASPVGAHGDEMSSDRAANGREHVFIVGDQIFRALLQAGIEVGQDGCQ